MKFSRETLQKITKLVAIFPEKYQLYLNALVETIEIDLVPKEVDVKNRRTIISKHIIGAKAGKTYYYPDSKVAEDPLIDHEQYVVKENWENYDNCTYLFFYINSGIQRCRSKGLTDPEEETLLQIQRTLYDDIKENSEGMFNRLAFDARRAYNEIDSKKSLPGSYAEDLSNALFLFRKKVNDENLVSRHTRRSSLNDESSSSTSSTSTASNELSLESVDVSDIKNQQILLLASYKKFYSEINNFEIILADLFGIVDDSDHILKYNTDNRNAPRAKPTSYYTEVIDCGRQRLLELSKKADFTPPKPGDEDYKKLASVFREAHYSLTLGESGRKKPAQEMLKAILKESSGLMDRNEQEIQSEARLTSAASTSSTSSTSSTPTFT